MGEVEQISEFGKILIFLIAGFILVGFTFFLSKLIAPNNPTPEKLTSYECGEEPESNSWMQFNPKFYVIALIFLLFDVEMVFIFPWATVFGNHDIIKAEPLWGWFSLAEMFVFIGILILGLVYVWAKGDLDWIKARPITPTVDTVIPKSLYDKVNQQQAAYEVKTFTLEPAQPASIPAATASVTATSPETAGAAATTPAIRFKPAFKKPANE
ncbi:NADH dehydrogenase [Mucilaginibacter sp. PPCGB 2223]|uniref:NADH-quinone oxidoreductase subunit A n=1 Tax=Mucilaginibacter sp. PPCGB 2223 TaxID=1886027 RepID=UPI0008242A5C|nr:NADH-quinone oxidoreductase subunit A [Mucilaginibacter sp. PPCGB 2223]OCX53805.1 NADH dehydrogenase [Mucilaginibacter sp. PPCGB 2223]